ncbi:hypothetical protein PENNAL_c0002G06694 [Penicillium nalgiovense]|uniref:Uncharacterized protein n=1 Tax=Penicillium nalgiovense TaxID=60175 RepID=A0A1V6Z710_PENNA|nr:hypothetical protein PENNAL_c0002G06694 [Penicillium nalgiovense]
MNSPPVDPEAIAPVAADASAGAVDMQLLAQIGYKQELRRQHSTPQGFAIAFSIMASNMNYTIVINGFVWLGCMAYHFIFTRRRYIGPKMTVDGCDSQTILLSLRFLMGFLLMNRDLSIMRKNDAFSLEPTLVVYPLQ